MENVVIRITRHDLDKKREKALRKIYGKEVIITTIDRPFTDDPFSWIEREIGHEYMNGYDVVAIEVQAPFETLSKIKDGLDFWNKTNNDDIHLIRSCFKREAGGRIAVIGKEDSGRDIFEFSHYEKIMEIKMKTEKL